MITRSAKFYGSELTRKVEDENIQVLFSVLGVKKNRGTIEELLKAREEEEAQLEREQAREQNNFGNRYFSLINFEFRVGNFFRRNWLNIILGALFTGFMIYLGNLNTLWMILVAFLFKL
jgi:hypothetical protein